MRSLHARRRTQTIALAVTVVLVVALASCSSGGSGSGEPPSACPLTGVKPSGAVPQHGALAVKIDNDPAARPPSGLSSADLVFEEPVEGFLTRFIVVFQCSEASRVEAVRSARLVDPDVLAPLGKVALAHDGGIEPAVRKLDDSTVADIDAARDPALFHRDPSRRPPHNEYTSTAALWPQVPAGYPTALFDYDNSTPSGTPARTVHVPFSHFSDVFWRYDASSGRYLRSYSTGAATSDGRQVAAANVVVEKVSVTESPYVEDASGAHEFDISTTGSGDATVYRNGVAIAGRWQRGDVGDVTSFTDSAGNSIALATGPTWIELVPSNVTVTATG